MQPARRMAARVASEYLLMMSIRASHHHCRFSGSHAIRQITGMVLAQEEVHVVKLHGIGAVLRHKMPQNGFGARRTLHALAIAVGRVDSAETAAERATDTGVMHRRTLPEKRGAKIFLDRNLVKRRPRKCVWAFHQPFRIVAMEAEDVLVGQTLDALELPRAAHRFQELEQRVFAFCPRTT